jgi:hypothetical protein
MGLTENGSLHFIVLLAIASIDGGNFFTLIWASRKAFRHSDSIGSDLSPYFKTLSVKFFQQLFKYKAMASLL